jgi:hypothetical protein
LGFELKTDNKGDGVGRSEQVIESSISQVLRGLNGFIEMMRSHPYRMSDIKATYLFPVIFTTAKLFAADIDLSTANQQTGRVDIDQENIKSVSWIIYQYPQSPDLKYQTGQERQSKENLTFSQFEYVRSVPIVNADGVEDFLRWASSIEIRNLFF